MRTQQYIQLINGAKEMPPYAVFYLDLNCLPKYLFTDIQNEMDLRHRSNV